MSVRRIMETKYILEPVFEVMLFTHDFGTDNIRCVASQRALTYDLACVYAQSFRKKFSNCWIVDPSTYIVIRDFEFYNKPF